MRPYLRSRPAVGAAAFVAVAMGAVGFVPLFGGPGYESALAAGILVPFAAALVTALETSAEPVEPFEAFCRGAANGAALVGVAFLTSILHGLRVGFCDLASGVTVWALGPGVGALLAGAWGALSGEIARGRERPWTRVLAALGLAFAAPLLSIAVSVSRFLTSPMVFAYDPFVGYFSGTLYDTVIDFSGLLSYRAGSAATLFAGFVAALHLAHDDEGRLAFQAIGRPGLLLFGGLSAIGSLTCVALGHRLHHWQTPETIAAELGARLDGDRCRVIYPRALRKVDAERFARECDAYVRQGERYFDVSGPKYITVYLFADAAQKASLMGAGDTNIAKPWRREVYVQVAGFPHPAIGHEVMHALASSFGRGPFKVGGDFEGLVPNPGLVEGVAVSAAPPEGDLLPREWAKAMKDLKILPPLRKLFALGFLGENSSTAYTVSGAFLSYVHDRFGPGAVRAWYGGTPLPEVTGETWEGLELEWHMALDREVLSDAAREQAKARFDRPAIFGRRCPHVVDGCRQSADRLRARGDTEGALAQYRRILELDPGEFAARFAMAKALVSGGRAEEGAAELQALASDEKFRRVERDRALEELGDLALARGDGRGAESHYREAAARMLDEDQLRTLEIKGLATTDEHARRAIVPLLVSYDDGPPDRTAAAEALGAWTATSPSDGLPLYLLARQHLRAGAFNQAALRLDAALAAKIGLPRVEVEAQRLRMVIACALQDTPATERWYKAYVDHPGISVARKRAAESLFERCGGKVGVPTKSRVAAPTPSVPSGD